MSVDAEVIEFIVHKLSVSSLENTFQITLNYGGVAISSTFHPTHCWIDCKQQFVDAVSNFAEKLSPHDLKVFSHGKEVTDTKEIFPEDELSLQPVYSNDFLPITAYTGTQETHDLYMLEALRKETLGLTKTQTQRTVHSLPKWKSVLGPWSHHSVITISSIDLYLDQLNFEVNVLKSTRHTLAKGTVIAGTFVLFSFLTHHTGVSCLCIPLDVPLQQDREHVIVWAKEYYCKGTPICKPNHLTGNARTKNCSWRIRCMLCFLDC